MEAPRDGQSRSKMLRRLFVLFLLALCGFVATRNSEALVRGISKTSGDCKDNSLCGFNETINRSTNFTEELKAEGEANNSTDVGNEARKIYGSGKGKGYAKVLLYVMGAAKAVMMYIMLHAVAAVAGKALVIAKVALAVATAIALKKDNGEKVSYEIVKHPHHSYVQTHSSSVDYEHDHHDHHDHHDGHDHHGYSEGYDHRKRRRILG